MPPITAIPQFVQTVLETTVGWRPVFPWFRGEPANAKTPLLPPVFRRKYDENNLLQTFRRRAHLLNLPVIPPVEATDQWLFLARHVGLPTRLLDWSEGALIGLYFALDSAQRDKESGGRSVVWMLNPHLLNLKSAPDSQPNAFALTWWDGRRPATDQSGKPISDATGQHVVRVNIGYENIAAAWEMEERGLPYPVAIEPTTIHPRMNAQHSYFTVHGRIHDSLTKIFAGDPCLQRFDIYIEPERGIKELRMMGIADSTIMPDADSLAKELSRFMVEE